MICVTEGILVAIGDEPAGRSLKSYRILYVYNARKSAIDCISSFPVISKQTYIMPSLQHIIIDSIFDSLFTMHRSPLSNISNTSKQKVPAFPKRKSGLRTGRWQKDERIAFLRGFRIYGKGNWVKIAQMIPNR